MGFWSCCLQVSLRQGAAKVYTVESSADTSTKKEQHKDQHILATLKAVQANLASVRSEVEKLRETAISQKGLLVLEMEWQWEQGHLVAKSVGERGKATAAHIAICALHAIVKPSIKVIWETHPGYPAGQGVASPEEEKSHQCSGCLKFDCHTQLLQCSACQSVR